MYKVLFIDKETKEILISKSFEEEDKAETFKNFIGKYTDRKRAEIKVEYPKVEKRRKICLKKTDE